jgi:Ca2+-transporting ATPase
MQGAPTPGGQALLTRPMLGRLALMAATSAGLVLAYFTWRLSTGVELDLVRTETFTLLAVCQWFNVLNCRSARQSALSLGVLRNGWLVGGLVLGNALQFLVVYTEPMNRLFHTAPIPLANFFLIGAVASLVLWVEELRKWIARRRRGRRAGA